MKVYEEDKNGLGREDGELNCEWLLCHVIDWISAPTWYSLLLFSLRGV